MDHLAKIFDMNVGKCRHSLRGHVDSVNAVHFQPFSNIVGTASADKTVSLWDLKTSLCVQTFYGHNNAVNDLCFNLVGDKLASCDSDGIVKVWDVRMVKEKNHYDSG
jgi:WD40 repeat protein